METIHESSVRSPSAIVEAGRLPIRHRDRFPFRRLSQLEQVLVPLDFSENSLVALRYAVNFAKQFQVRLTLLHVVETAPLPLDYGFYDLPSEEEVRAAERRLEQLVAEYAPDMEESITRIVRCGRAEAALCRAAWDVGADMIILSTHAYTGLKNVFFGGITTGMVRHAPCPILVVRNDDEVPSAVAGTGLHHFLVPIDFSARSEAALPCAAKLAEKCHGDVSLLHVIEPALVDEEITTLGTRYAAYSDAASRRLRSVESRALPERIRGSVAIRRGMPSQQIIAEAQRVLADLIVITTHGRTGMEHLFMGSTAERLMKQSPCPVLIVREPAA